MRTVGDIAPAHYPAPVTLALEHLVAIEEPIARQLRYLCRLRRRLEKRGFSRRRALPARAGGLERSARPEY
jgi:hypothetical protein